MKKYTVSVDFQGYVRGTHTYVLEAESEAEAERTYVDHAPVDTDLDRDDTEIVDITIGKL